jgi:hypothetical protein
METAKSQIVTTDFFLADLPDLKGPTGTGIMNQWVGRV